MPKTIHEAPSGPEPIGAYSVATEANGFVFLSGQVGIDPATRRPAGDTVAAQARQVLQNIGAILADVGLGYDDVVKTTVFLSDIRDFAEVNGVYGEFFGQAPPARSAIQAAALPGGYLVEIEVVAAR